MEKNLKYVTLDEENIKEVISNYIYFFNEIEGGTWNYENSYKRISQYMKINDSLCKVVYDDDKMIGFFMGYFKEFDDLTAYYLEEILVFYPFQKQGYGKIIIKDLEKMVKDQNVKHIELLSINDEFHMHFYKSLGLYEARTLVVMAKDL